MDSEILGKVLRIVLVLFIFALLMVIVDTIRLSWTAELLKGNSR